MVAPHGQCQAIGNLKERLFCKTAAANWMEGDILRPLDEEQKALAENVAEKENAVGEGQMVFLNAGSRGVGSDDVSEEGFDGEKLDGSADDLKAVEVLHA